MIRLFCGYDKREAVGYHVFQSSVIRNTGQIVNFIPISDITQEGSNAFTYSRFNVAKLCDFEGWAIFADASDMLCLGDIAELWAMRDSNYAVKVVKHSYKTRNPIKYLGTTMQCPNIDYPRKNWASLMLINCAAREWKNLSQGVDLLRFNGFDDSRIGELPSEWNCLVDEGQINDNAKLLHWTAGIPGFPIYKDAARAADWHLEFERMSRADV